MSTVPHAASPAVRFAFALSWAFRTMLDRAIPAGLFGFAALSRLSMLIRKLGQSPADDAELLAYRLDLAHQAIAFVFLALVALLCLTRKSPRARAGLLPLLIALAGTLMMMYPAMQPPTIGDRWALLSANVLVIAGLLFTVYAVLSLGSCFGIAPEARGLVTGGAYQLVRHPVYLGEFIASLGVLVPVLSPLTAIAFALFVGLQLYRIRLEEQVLGSAFDEYSLYREHVPMILPWPRPSR